MHEESFLDKRLAREDSIVSREIVGEVVLVPIRRTVGQLDSIYSLNEIAARIWNLIDGTRSIGRIAEQIADEYDVEREVAIRDTAELCKELIELGVAREI